MKTIPANTRPTLRQRIAELQNALEEKQNEYVQKSLDDKPTLRDLRRIVQTASKLDFSADGETIYNAGTRFEYIDTKI